ncbi:MAG: ABC transporter ATP-binding protein [Candidatus Eisenbacteria bacterium]|uniref:ABC transporter ATP-binding protein n=1 Tax=Eiseniibacteriota bacterium TaxID=2212470 RepID=A0A7Y2H208_UNCEI|nr:ABC transporter ATP-binding protein [Candidatus Eisenbacteria bacterium]
MNTLYTLIPYLKRHRTTIGIGSLFLVLTSAFQMAGPWILKLAFDGLESSITKQELLVYAGILVAIAIVAGICRFFMRRLLIGTSREIEYELRQDFFRKLTVLSFSYYNRTPTGDLMARATNDLTAVRMVLGPGVMYTMTTVITLTASVTLMALLSWKLMLISLAPMPLISLFMYLYGGMIHKRFESVQEQFASITARAQEYLAGIRVVRAYGQEESAKEEFSNQNQEYLDRYMKLVRINGLMHPSIRFLAGTATILVLLFGGIMVMNETISLGDFVAFFAYLNMLIWPMIALGWVVSIFQRGAASMKRINYVFNSEAEIVDSPHAVDKEDLQGAIEFRDVHFTYRTRPDESVLRGINLKIEPGETIGIAGRTGSGKTTLVNLIPRLFAPDKGEILIDGSPITHFTLNTLRNHIGYVPQEAFLFSRTLAENIRYGEPEASQDAIENAAELAQLSGDVSEFPKTYETAVGERGVTLSGGQKQRAAIARAVIRSPRILILDDALASVDTRTEEAILGGLRSYMSNRTTLLVAHRVSTLKLADRIVLLENGQITEMGTHDELVAKGGAYAELARMQELKDQLEATS